VSDDIDISAEDAISLLADGETVHNFSAGPAMIGADWPRDDAIEAIKTATMILLATVSTFARGLKHPIFIEQPNGRRSCFAADMEKVAAFERSKGIARR
jgi:hypothetical protein